MGPEEAQVKCGPATGFSVEESAPMLIDPYPWSAPLEEVRLKKN